MSQPTPTQPTQPTPQPAPYGGYPAGAPYAGYPAYPYYGYPGYPYYPGMYQPYPQPVPPRSPSERPGKPGAARVRNLVLVAIGVVLTVAAIVAASLAAISGQSVPSPVSGGLRQVYSQQLSSDAVNWTFDQGCALQNGGLLADGASNNGAICDFVPSGKQDLLSQGFQLTLVMAPGADVPTVEEGGIILGQQDTGFFVDFTQEGNYAFYIRGGGAPLISGSTIAWHADASLANTISLRYSTAIGELDAYVNGQQVFTHALTLDQGTELALASPDGAQALFTSFALYSAL